MVERDYQLGSSHSVGNSVSGLLDESFWHCKPHRLDLFTVRRR